MKRTSGCSASSWAIFRRTASPTATALVSAARWIDTETTGLPFSNATSRGSAVPSVTVASDESRTERPSGREIG